MARKQIAFTEATHMKIERAALDISIKTGKIVKWTDVVHFMVENYLEDVKKDMVHSKKDVDKKQSE
ncbi:hypothetical protein ATT74_26095 [Salmonella enterica subsp. enterica serovar Panama]|uniref:Uncharacterized protein n=1 Tax=Salmonella enterica subsp. enterica serovar Panama TaxID=29472 RepID=A0A619AFI4_SALET|nr:hypothetical protein [Salmonella enterica subsp. enterica serovar Panama]EGU5379584.1 hypothetical protein [Salmonella enterica]ECX3494245.1 hypothetical protein [Salmonella enterica subsp. enterica serovar Panama]ECX6033866.1 hypothetical protein [Salmonella enterica subsp. enterica serovar Panama]EGX1719561.1 hypothetical protein [Salmonella enterica subsp. enterica serovar Panama]